MGLSSFECPVCNKSILHDGLTGLSADLDEGWSEATLVLPGGVVQGSHDGYGNIDDVNFYALAVHGKPKGLKPKDYDKLHETWWDSQKNMKSKEYPIKMYHTYCWENSGKPNFQAAKASKSAKDQGHFITERRYSTWPPPGKKANPAKEGKGVEDGDVVRLEFSEGTSNKFWEYTDQGDGTAMLRWGRIGTQGQSQMKSIQEAKKRAAAKEKKGYYPVSAALKGQLRVHLAAAGIKTYRNHQGRSFIRREDIRKALTIASNNPLDKAVMSYNSAVGYNKTLEALEKVVRQGGVDLMDILDERGGSTVDEAADLGSRLQDIAHDLGSLLDNIQRLHTRRI